MTPARLEPSGHPFWSEEDVVTNMQRASAILRKHLAPWMVGEAMAHEIPEDEFDCCVRELALVGLLTPENLTLDVSVSATQTTTETVSA